MTAASTFLSSLHPHHHRSLAHCQSMGQRKMLRLEEILPRVRLDCIHWPGSCPSNTALVFPLTASLPENAVSSGWVLRATVSPLNGKIDSQTAWVVVRLCGSGDALCTPPPPSPASVSSMTGVSQWLLSLWLAVLATLGVPRGSVCLPHGRGAWRVSLVPVFSYY